MGKKKEINELTNILSKALAHKIGSIVNANKPYAEKYEKDTISLTEIAREIVEARTWNVYDKLIIRE